MRESIWLGVGAREAARQLARHCGNTKSIIPVVTEIAVVPTPRDDPVRNIDVFNLQDRLIEQLRAGISHRRVAPEQWIGFDRARGVDTGWAEIRLYARILPTVAELSFIDRVTREIAGETGKCLRIGYGLGVLIDFQVPRGEVTPTGWDRLAPLVRFASRPRAGPDRATAVRVCPRWLIADHVRRFREPIPPALKPGEVEGYLRRVESNAAAVPHNAVLGLALVSELAESASSRPRPLPQLPGTARDQASIR
jgi:hypothetical protein